MQQKPAIFIKPLKQRIGRFAKTANVGEISKKLNIPINEINYQKFKIISF